MLERLKSTDFRETLLQARIIRIGWITGGVLAVPSGSIVTGAWRRVGNSVACWQIRSHPFPDFGMGVGKIHYPGIPMPISGKLIIRVPTGGIPTREFVVINAVSGHINENRRLRGAG